MNITSTINGRGMSDERIERRNGGEQERFSSGTPLQDGISTKLEKVIKGGQEGGGGGKKTTRKPRKIRN